MRCRRGRHDWFPNLGAHEFIVGRDTCLRCNSSRAVLPYGQCLGGHPIAEHYNVQGDRRPRELVQLCSIGEPA